MQQASNAAGLLLSANARLQPIGKNEQSIHASYTAGTFSKSMSCFCWLQAQQAVGLALLEPSKQSLPVARRCRTFMG